MNVIREAIVVLAERGHCKRYLEDEKGRVCLWGAVGVAAHGNTHQICSGNEWQPFLDSVAEEQYPERVSDQTVETWSFYVPSSTNFNNHPDTTVDEVVRVMEKAAIRWDEQV
jgi:hypothetical protein